VNGAAQHQLKHARTRQHPHEGGKPMANTDDTCDSSGRNPTLDRIVKERAHTSRSSSAEKPAPVEREYAGADHHGQRSERPAWQDRHIARTIETEIIPRLLLSHIVAPRLQSALVPAALVPELPDSAREDGKSASADVDIAAFADLVIHHSLKAATQFIDGLILRGFSHEAIIEDVFTITARHLGHLWEEDQITFVDVSLGLSRLHQVLRLYSPAFEADFIPKVEGQRILLVAMPGEQHTFGLSVVESYFRRDGWDVQCETAMTRADLLQQVQQEHYDVVGISASADSSVNRLAPLIQACRDFSRNKGVRVIVGGCHFLAQPENALALGADLVARDGKEAILNVAQILEGCKN
jgi:MerR family transcriptional regulator, light-induced transcriptional regulator